MKRFLKYFSLVVACLAAMSSQAREINIDADDVKGDFSLQLRSMCERAGYDDTVVLTFGKGTYTIDLTIQFRCNVVIKGAGQDKTTIIFDKGSNRTGSKAFTDDTFLKVFGTLKHPVTFSLTDLTIKLKQHSGIWWQNEREMYAVKIHHANKLEVSRVSSYMQDAKITNFDFHVCSNVYVTDCIISNYNNCDTGGNLWVRGTMDNINIKRNKFYKYGKDEAVAIFDRLVDNSKGYIRGEALRTNIFIEDNEFYYGGYKGKNKNPEAVNGMILSLITDHAKSDVTCTTRNFHVSGNKFYINDVTTRCMYISFEPADVHKDIIIENNRIENAYLNSDMEYYREDIEVNDLSHCGDTIRIYNNSVKNKNLVLNKYGSHGYSFLLLQGGIVCMDGNTIVNECTINPKTRKSTGVQLVLCGSEGGSLTMRNNVCKGIKYISTVGEGAGTDMFTFNAFNNYFAGDTRIYCNKIKQLHLNFTGNTFVSEDMNFFLQEFAPQGTLIFNNNDVTIAKGNGQLMTHWNKTPTHQMRFDQLEIKNNVFRGVRSEKNLLEHFTNTKKRTVRNNTIR